MPRTNRAKKPRGRRQFHGIGVRQQSLTLEQSAHFDKLMIEALSFIDEDNYDAFWKGIEELNRFLVLCRD